MSNSKLSFTRV